LGAHSKRRRTGNRNHFEIWLDRVPNADGPVLHALPLVQIHRFQERWGPKPDREGVALAPASVSVLSLWSPLLPVSMACAINGMN
jgi:hypothetical protein